MKTVDYYLTLPYRLEITKDSDGGFIGSYPELPGCLTCADSIENLLKNAHEAKKEWIIAAIESNTEIKEPSNDKF